MKALRWIAAALLGAACSAGAQAQNVLANPSFETVGGIATGWTTFGNVFRERVIPVSGDYSIKLFGNFAPEVNFSGLYQEFPASSGQEWTVSVTATNPAFDALQGGNRALVKIEFRDAGGAVLSMGESAALTAASPVGVQSPLSVTTAAPIGATTARVILLFEQQADFAGGSAFCDLVTASVLGSGAVTVTNDSFESGAGVIAGWNSFNNAVRTTNGPRTGAANLTFTSGTNSGVFQSFPALPGSVWQASVWALNSSSSSPMQLPDFVVLNVEWRDAVDNLLSFDSALVADGFTALDTYAQSQFTATAPPGTASARFVLLYNFTGGTGTLQIDDASFVQISSPPPPPPDRNLLNNPGFELALGFDFSNQANWNGFFGGPANTFLEAFNTTGATPRSGDKALVTTIRGNAMTNGFNAFTGHVQVVSGITPGSHYELSVWARTNPTSNAGAEFRVEWRNAANAEVSRLNMPIESMLTDSYQKFTLTDTAPPGAAKAAIVMAVQSFIHTGPIADISVAWDDASFGIPACPSDFNGDTIVDPDDLSDFITCYFSETGSIGSCVQANFNGDLSVDPDDLSDFITAYFSPC